MGFALKFAGETLDDVATWDEPLEFKVGEEEFPRRHGSLVQEVAFLRSRRIVLTGRVFKDDEATLKTYLEDLKQTFIEKGRDRLQLRDDNRYLNAILSGFSTRYIAGQAANRGAPFSLEFLADDPFWYSDTEKTNAQDAIASSPHTYSITNSGKAHTPPRIEIKAAGGDATDVKLTNTTTGLFARFAGTISNGQTLIINSAKRTVTNGAANGLNDFTGSFWEFVAGVNNLQYEGPTGVDVVVYWTERYV